MFDNYEKLNEYFKDIYTYLQKKNPYLLNNICKITTLSGTVLNLLEVMFIHTSRMTVKLLKWFLLRENIIIVM